ncbi:Trehalase [Gemmata obscuriglobus]|uniref:Trehalase n=1 Tax=Gemmata obscuriglobus TaxID=114 RepID=A0A2Z3HC25_9BACT|nr:glycoside hydrolase family 15 protein [Gemmata obscuriglobus]AWM38770.1 glucoamylase [Gemmata obscuriglobus]QEG28254.1 Trehalase [Gemmata obscuriglobus]VTS06043.1 glucoamylase : Glycoside hydrolase 15-related protein OS=Isosphaera pallida (strain ATCC 43644 / DSM 9630 / IS1B) GN=Isop_2661 PE=4 SV=1: Glyco_hydro_15 [Gemmata obscuriglobus UQM 2246]
MTTHRIEDYALIGDCHTAALVGRDGSLDWLCLPRFDSPACFAALLGTADHGRWTVAPAEDVMRVSRTYRGDSLVLETTFTTPGGEVTVVDCMPVRTAQPDVVRLVIGRRGVVRMRTHFAPRLDYGSLAPWVRPEGGGVVAVGGPEALHLRAPVPLRIDGWAAAAEFEVRAGEEVPFVLTWHPSHTPLHPPIDARAAVNGTAAWWQAWADRCTYEGEYRDAVVRSLVTLKALTYAPTGGIVAAPTTSLPEHIGGVRNWDYRYCWLRDATFTLAALLQSGYADEAKAWREWLLRAVAGKGADLRIMYGVGGERRLPETELPWLPGYEGSQPVRVGNGAYDQFQLDVFGETLDCLHLARHYGLSAAADDWRVERELLGRLEDVWREPDEGIWEVRGPARHFTHSKVMAWVAFDRAVKDVERFGLGGPVDRWRALRDGLHAEVCARGFSRERNAFTQFYGSTEVDAAVLVMAEVGFLPPTDPRLVGTVAAVESDLVRDGFVDRYRTESGVDGLPKGEGAFLLCTFWLADNYALMGRTEDARRVLERVLAVRNDVGLLAEEYDPVARRQLGNFPQAFSHLGLVNTARNLTQREKPAQVRTA